MTLRVNPHGADWQTIRAWIDRELATAHRRLEQDLGPIETAVERGRIRAMRDLLAQVEPDPAPTVARPSPYA